MHPEKGKEASLKNVVDQQSREIGKLKAENERLKNPPKKPKKNKNYGKIFKKVLAFSAKSLLVLIVLAVCAYILIWIFEPASKMVVYKGQIISITTTRVSSKKTTNTLVNKCKTKTSNGKTELFNCKKTPTVKNEGLHTKNIVFEIIFTDIDNDLRKKGFSTVGRNDWGRKGLGILKHDDLVPFPKKYKDSDVYVGKSNPYIGCMVKVFELRGWVLNSNTVRDFIADVSMCNKKAEKSIK